MFIKYFFSNGKYIMDTFSVQIQEKIKTWSNTVLKNVNQDKKLKYIMKHHKLIYSHIMKTYDNLNTLKSHLSALAVIFRTLLGVKSRLYKKYSAISTDLNKKVEDAYKDQTPKKDSITLSEIEQKRDELKELYEKDKTNKKINLQYLLLSLYTYQPCLRQDYKNMLVVNKVPNKTDNFILHKNGKYNVVIQKDKVSNTYVSIIFELNDTLNSIIDDSLKNYPRKYILSLIRDGNKPIGKQGFETLLKSCFTNHVTVDMLRSAYITDRYNKGITNRQKEELATKMRHSASIASQIYHKIEGNEEPIEEEPKDDIRSVILKILNRNKKSFKVDDKVTFEISYNGFEWT